MQNRYIFVIGGYEPAAGQFLSKIDKYDREKDFWTLLDVKIPVSEL